MSSMNISGAGKPARKVTEGAEKGKTLQEVMDEFKNLVKEPVGGMEGRKGLKDFFEDNKDLLKEKGAMEEMLKFIDNLSGSGKYHEEDEDDRHALGAIDALIEIDELKESLKDSMEFRAIVGRLQDSWESGLELGTEEAIEKKFLEWETLAHIENRGLLPEAGFLEGFKILLNKIFSDIAAFFGFTGYEVSDDKFRAMHPKKLETIEKLFLQENVEDEEKVYKDITYLFMLSRSEWIREADAKKIADLLTKEALISKLRWSFEESGYVIKTFLTLAESGKIDQDAGNRIAETVLGLVRDNKVPLHVRVEAMKVFEKLINNGKVSEAGKNSILDAISNMDFFNNYCFSGGSSELLQTNEVLGIAKEILANEKKEALWQKFS